MECQKCKSERIKKDKLIEENVVFLITECLDCGHKKKLELLEE